MSRRPTQPEVGRDQPTVPLRTPARPGAQSTSPLRTNVERDPRSAAAGSTAQGSAGWPPTARRKRRPAGVLGWLGRIVVGTLVIAILIVGGTAFRVWQVARVDDRQAVDAIVVLGAAQYGGEPSEIFAYRLRHAEALYESGLAPRIVTTGGSRSGDAFTEAEAGRRYLLGRGVPARALVAVGTGDDTLSSLRAVAERALADGWESALVVSDPWHSLRARTMARDSGLQAWTSPTRSGPVVQTRETQARYIVRETGALLYYQLTHDSIDTPTTGVG